MPRRRDKEIYSYKLKKSGKIRWAFKTYIGLDPETGKAHNVTRQGFKTYKDAEQAKFDLKSQTVDQVVLTNNKTQIKELAKYGTSGKIFTRKKYVVPPTLTQKIDGKNTSSRNLVTHTSIKYL